ncbi:MAG: pantoate--beta-alanine ligase [Tannerellaceae bacterium]|jgi:pantoate--beta-alanine ligase|nr:pantoate--beta-alanine ligase [Tannerellaceae bacterium]
MITVKSIKELSLLLEGERLKNRRIGFVPTMGALHEGHLSLVRRCVEENDICVASVFVNPTQFNDKSDLEAYPRTLERDAELLRSAGCHYLFAPSEEEMYPQPDTRCFDFGPLAQVMEGAHRAGHFNGVAQIVSKLFEAVGACRAYFGEKDFQQIAIIREMLRQLKMPVEIVACPIIREADGLAMSSRNTRLSREQRQKAPLIAQTLKESTNFAPGITIRELIDFVVNRLNREPLLQVEYYEIVDGHTLQAIQDWGETTYAVGCIAVYCGDVRLIDNIMYKNG